jgi:8-amino-7-oxononanoate synthase
LPGKVVRWFDAHRSVNEFEHKLSEQLAALREQHLHRELRRIDAPQGPRIRFDGRDRLNFSSNDYLGLANHSGVKEGARRAIDSCGAGSGASRLISGSLQIHHELEQGLAEFKGTPAALTFSSGYAAAVGIIGALLGKDDVIIVDKLAHASIIDAARLCGAKLRVFSHNDLNELEDILKWASGRTGAKLVATESVFSMDGDLAPLREIVDLKERYGAWLMLDEAHATGLFGKGRRGLADAFELSEHVEISMGTLGKALGSAGGFVCGSRSLIELLVNRARSFIFSTAPAPAQSGAALAAVRIVQSQEGEDRRTTLWSRVDQVKNGLVGSGWPLPVVRSPILPLIVGDEGRALEVAAKLREAGVFVPAVRYPTVARGAARLRVTLTAAHSSADVAELLQALGKISPLA